MMRTWMTVSCQTFPLGLSRRTREHGSRVDGGKDRASSDEDDHFNGMGGDIRYAGDSRQNDFEEQNLEESDKEAEKRNEENSEDESRGKDGD